MFYDFRQNNSGGSFKVTDSVGHYVIIEADNAQEANEKAEQVGIYFDGCSTGKDCNCCGDRWYPQWDSDGSEEPSIYGENIEEYKNSIRYSVSDEEVIFVYYKGGHSKKIVIDVKSEK